jgi:hypothetical protein
MENGDKDVGEECGALAECAPGSQCLDRSGAEKIMCYTICDECRPCPVGTCTDTELGFSVCLEESPADSGAGGG